MILNHVVWMEYIGANLAAPFDLLLISLQGGDLLFLLLLFQLKELGTEHLQALLTVLNLGAFILTLYHDAGRLMGHADCGRCLIDMLTTSTAGTVGIYTNLIHIDFYLNGIIQLRHNVAGTEGGMAAGC